MSSTTIQFITGFGGVLFGAALSWLWFIFEKHLERRRKHFNALVAIEYAMSENLDTSYSNMIGLKLFKAALGQKQFYYPSFKQFNLPQSTIYDLQNLKFANNVFETYLDMDRVNRDLLAISDRYNKVVDRFMLASTSVRHGEAFNEYSENANILISDLDLLLSFSEKLDQRLVKTTAESQVLHQHKPRWVVDVVIGWWSKSDSNPGDFTDKVVLASERIQKEREQQKADYEAKR